MKLANILFMKNKFGSQAAPTVSSDVLIVGGGIAGFTTALKLLDLAQAAGLPKPSITILEAGNELGGRAKTVALANGGTASTGAQWFHGGKNDPFYVWVKDRYPQLKFDFDAYDSEISVNSRGENKSEAFRELDELFYKKWAEYHAANPGKDMSLKDFAASIDHPQAQEPRRLRCARQSGAGRPGHRLQRRTAERRLQLRRA